MPDLNHEKVMTMLHQSASSVLETFDEPVAVLLAVAWDPRLGEEDLPFGTAVFRKEHEGSPMVLATSIRQTTRLLTHLADGTSRTGSRFYAQVKGQADVIQQQRETIDELQRRLSKWEKKVGEDAGPHDHGVDPASDAGSRRPE